MAFSKTVVYTQAKRFELKLLGIDQIVYRCIQKMGWLEQCDRLTQHWFGEPNIPTISGTLYLSISYIIMSTIVGSCWLYVGYIMLYLVPTIFNFWLSLRPPGRGIVESWFGHRFFIALTTKKRVRHSDLGFSHPRHLNDGTPQDAPVYRNPALHKIFTK